MSRRARRKDPEPPPPAAPPAGPSRRWLDRAPLVAAAVAAATYAPSLFGGFLYDDGELIVRNPSIRSLRALSTVLAYEPARPLLNLSWALNYAVSGLDPWSYHLVNVLIHAANAALLASLFLWMGRKSGRAAPEAAALVGACLFAASPMAAETVAYVASRSSALVAFFAFLSLRLAVRGLESGRRRPLALSVGAFLLALATKEEAAAVPLVLLLLDYYFLAGQRWAELRRRLGVHAVFVAIVVAGILARRLATGTWLPAPAGSPWLYVLTQWAAFPLYLLRAVLPLDPAFYRYHPPATWPPDGITAGFALVTLVLLVLVVRRGREGGDWAFAVLCLAAGLLPSSSVVALQEMVVDHRAYLGSFGVAFAAGGLLWRWAGARGAAIVLVLLAARSLHYEWVLGDPARAWEDAVRRAPASADAHCALGEVYADRNDPRAEESFRKALALHPGHYRYWANLGTLYAGQQRLDEAARALGEAVTRNPGDAAIRDYRGQVLEALGRADEAAAEFEAAVAAEPSFALARINLAASALRRGDRERARVLLETASRLAIDPAEAARIVELQRRLR
jgi:tetratricopeptide (TPR) repeat protein